MPPKEISQESLIRIFKGVKENKSSETRFCFLLGAGASVSSGIPTGGQLAKRWYEVLQEDLSPRELKEWKKKVGFDEKRIAEFYTHLYQKRFEPCPKDRFDEFKTLMGNTEPDIGYVILAQVLVSERHNFVITTNFDYLVEDAVRMYTPTKPFAVGHEKLASHISSRTERPTIIKVHRDLFLHPFNSNEETNKLKEEWKEALHPILNQFNLLVVGYGGNDGSLMDYLADIDAEDRNAIYWCKRERDELSDKVNKLLDERDFVVNIDGFDQLMYGLNRIYEYDIFKDLDKPEEHKIVQDAKRRVAHMNGKLNEILKEELSKATLRNIKSLFKGGVPEYIYRASIENDIDKKEEIYLAGIEEYPDDTNLLNNYGVYLGKFRKNYEKAIEYYQKAIEIKPNKHEAFNNWGITLGEMAKTKSDVEAETLSYQAIEKYKKAIEIKPNNYESFHGWGNILIDLVDIKTGEEKEAFLQEAIQKFQKTTEIKPDYYSGFYSMGMLFKKLAETKSGLESETLCYQAIEYYKKAIEIKPDHYRALNNWGATLNYLALRKRKTGEEKETFLQEAIQKFQKAIKIKPDFAKAIRNWGTVLGNLAKIKSGEAKENLYCQAFEKYKKAIEIKPDFKEAFYNWGTNLLELAKIKPGKETKILLKEALEKFQKSIEIKSDKYQPVYNLACTYALLSDKKNALLYLEQSLENKEITTDHVLQDEDWQAYLKDKDFQKIIQKYSDK